VEDLVEREPLRRRGDAEIGARAGDERPRASAGREPTTGDVDERAGDDADHVVEERGALDDDGEEPRISLRALDEVDPRDRARRLGALVARGAKCPEIVRPEEGRRLRSRRREIEPAADAPRDALEMRVTNRI